MRLYTLYPSDMRTFSNHFCLTIKRKSGICLPHKITKHWQIAKIIYGFLQVMVGPFPVRHKNYQNVSPMKSENALKTKNPPEEKFLRGIRNGKKIT